MTVLRQKMIDDMQLHGFAVRTQEADLLAVRQLAKHYHKPLDQINEEELALSRSGVFGSLSASGL